jgi:2-methylisocitrate lyase-like PEP mutase family enzyme
MSHPDFTASFQVAESPEVVFQTIMNVRSWWSGLYGEDIQQDGDGGFTFRAGGGAHYSSQKLAELVPGRKVVWLVTESKLGFVSDGEEWTGKAKERTSPSPTPGSCLRWSALINAAAPGAGIYRSACCLCSANKRCRFPKPSENTVTMNEYETFYQLHHQPQPLVIANAWNAKSAQIIEQAGFSAIATSSGAIAESLGYRDGEQIPFEELLYIVRRIKASTAIPLSVDMEKGYSDDPDQLQDHIEKLLEAGAVGINIEDSQEETLYLKKLERIKNHLTKTGQQLFVNARTDGFLQKAANPLEQTILRAGLYQKAGADGLFVTGVQDPTIISEITAATSLPVNIVGHPGLASFKALAACGVKRISMAVLLYKATYKQLERIAGEVKAERSLTPLFM